MAKFTTPSLVSETIWNMRLADLPRGTNRGLINSLVNGNPPYTKQEAEENNIEINVNFLDATQLCADARRSLYNAFQAPGKFFTVTQDFGPAFKRQQWGREITTSINRIMKRSRLYAECLDSQFAATVLHGFGPAVGVGPSCPVESTACGSAVENRLLTIRFPALRIPMAVSPSAAM